VDFLGRNLFLAPVTCQYPAVMKQKKRMPRIAANRMFRVMLCPWGQAAVNMQFNCVLSDFRFGVKWVSSKGASGRERDGNHCCQSWSGYLCTDPRKGAHLGTVTLSRHSTLLLLVPLAGDVQGWLASMGKTRGGCREKDGDDLQAPGVGLRWGPRKAAPLHRTQGQGDTVDTSPV